MRTAEPKWIYSVVLDAYLVRIDADGDAERLTVDGKWVSVTGADNMRDVRQHSRDLELPAARTWAEQNQFKWAEGDDGDDSGGNANVQGRDRPTQAGPSTREPRR